MGEVEEKIGADYLRLLAARQRLSVMDSEIKKMINSLNLAVSLLSGKETGHFGDDGTYHVHNRPNSGIPHRQLTLPTLEELNRIIDYRKQAKEEVDTLSRQFKKLEAQL